MHIYDIIQKKRDNKKLNSDEIEYFITNYVNGTIPDYQASALLMAIYLNGMDDEELTNLTNSMAHSGDMVDLSKINGNTVDKHSTGGVGDKTSMIICPIVAALGTKIAKMSGRGLGFTGGTIDKLESIPGFNTALTNEEFYNQVNDINIAIISQTGNITPADKKIYALRDTTATVESIPLIASSIMSKKIAAGDKNILLDVKVGSGAFMKNIKDATKLATKMVKIGKSLNRNMMAIITNMDEPLGNNIGNSLEVMEAIDVLKGNGPKDLKDICVELATNMLILSTKQNKNTCRKQVLDVIQNGKALNKFKEMIIAQHGNPEVIDNYNIFTKPSNIIKVLSDKEGYITNMNTELIGKTSVLLGAGRSKKDDIISYEAGIVINYKINDHVNVGDILATLYTSNPISEEEVISEYKDAITISKYKVSKHKNILKYIK